MSGEEASTAAEIREAIREIDALLKVRNRHLAAYERLLLDRLLAGEITLLNLAGRKSRAIFVTREKALIQLQSKIIRRNIFYLRVRRDRFIEDLKKMGASLEEPGSNAASELVSDRKSETPETSELEQHVA